MGCSPGMGDDQFRCDLERQEIADAVSVRYLRSLILSALTLKPDWEET
jgi:hypothetical protein